MADENENNSNNESGDAPPPLAESANLISELEAAKRDFLYLRADFDNYKKSAIKERSDLIRYGNEPLLIQLLSLLDTFDQALKLEINAENIKSFRDGVQMIRSEFGSVLTRFGVTPIDSVGQPFDPKIHEALGSEPNDSFPPGHISTELKRAYKLHDRVIRPAQVIVAKEADTNSKDN